MCRPSNAPWFNYPNKIWWSLKLRSSSLCKFFVTSRYFLHLRSKYPPQHPVLKIPSIHVLPLTSETKLYAHTKQSVFNSLHVQQLLRHICNVCSLIFHWCEDVRLIFWIGAHINCSDKRLTMRVNVYELQYEGVSKSFRTGRLERELQRIQLSATRCSSIAILWIILVSFAAIILCVASQREFIFVVVYFVMTQSGNFWIYPRIIILNWSYFLKLKLLCSSASFP